GPLNYIFTLTNYWALDGLVGGSGAEYINHSCDPNLVTRIFKGHILYYSRRQIHKGEELTVDYHFAHDVEKVPCSCGTTKCRGTINLKK
ncbi:MAG TPA: SET domain-containing protein-lysine N-methyltransferase, partial [Bryobacteraceae bacterium]|nr:SET domain-containing protein-lysine N-methyltransferase [Bryobacteraceae bacterium]